jgi:hypothetical protein
MLICVNNVLTLSEYNVIDRLNIYIVLSTENAYIFFRYVKDIFHSRKTDFHL